MRRGVLMLVLLLAGSAAVAQSRFSGAVSVGMGISLSEPASTPLLVRVTGYYNPHVRWAVGAGVGLSFYEKTLIPLYADAKFLLIRPRRFTPYLQCAAGYAFAPLGEANGGLYVVPSVGVQYALRGGTKLFLSAGWELQKMQRLKRYDGAWLSAEFSERLSHQSLTVRLGWLF